MKLGITFSQLPSRYQKWRKTFRLQADKLLGMRRKAYILDVICNRFYLGEVQEDVIGQCTGQGISEPRAEGLSVYQ